MNFVKRIRSRLRGLFAKRRLDAEMEAEMRSHLEMLTQENIAGGMSAEEARYAALRQFGHLEGIKETCREQREGFVGRQLSVVGRDLLFAMRQLWRNPGFAAVAVLTLALGIGVNTTMFGLVNAVLFRPLPFPNSDRLVRIYRTSSRSTRDGLSIGVFLDLREQNTVFEHVAAYYPQWPCNLAASGEPAQLVSGMLVTADFFPTLGIQPERGRGFTAAEDEAGHDDVVVLSHEFWQRRFGGDRNIVGRTLRLDGRNVTVVGVMPESFHYPLLWRGADLLRPFAFRPDQRQSRGDNWRFAFGRLKPGVTVAQAGAELKALAGRFARLYPKTQAGYGLRALSLRASCSEGDSPIMWLSLGLAGFVLLIACANLANLFLARLAGRTRELTIRLALGAGRSRLLRQLLTESLLVSLIGGGLGLLLAIWAKDFLGQHISVGDQAGLAFPLDPRVLGFTVLSCVVTALLFGTAPAWMASRTDVRRHVSESPRGSLGGPRRRPCRRALVVGEVALALTLLAGAGLFVRGFQELVRRDPGWRVDGLLTGELDLTSAQYQALEKRRVFFRELEQRLSAIPGVHSVSISSRPPVLEPRFNRDIAIEGRPPAPPGQQYFAGFEPVSPGYFHTVGIRLKEGRLFSEAGAADQHNLVVVNETMARQCWPNESPLGKRIADAESANPTWKEIVGVVENVRYPGELDGGEPRPEVYCPLAQEPPTFATVELRVNGAMAPVAAALRSVVAAIDPDQSVSKITTARQLIHGGLQNLSLLGDLLTAFAVLGLLLAAIGIYGVLGYTVAQRSGEFGLRMAIGARRTDVLWLVLGQGLRHTLFGALLGFAGAFGVARALVAAMPFPMPADLLTFAGVGLILIAVALLACFVPAWRATKVDPMEVLRCE